MQSVKKYIEQTLLRPNISEKELINFLETALRSDFLGVCINPCHIKTAKKYLYGSDLKVITVIGFPLGANFSSIKAQEAKECIEMGADEVDMVIDIYSLKNAKYTQYQNDIKAVVEAAGEIPVKTILETDYLTKDEIATGALMAAQAGASFIKTSTGYAKNGVGAKVEDIKIIKEVLSFDFKDVKIKASGGIKNYETAKALIDVGADRIGTSSGIDILLGENN